MFEETALNVLVVVGFLSAGLVLVEVIARRIHQRQVRSRISRQPAVWF
jgi:uncharacterized membrane protein YjjB (DUF3815 family)